MEKLLQSFEKALSIFVRLDAVVLFLFIAIPGSINIYFSQQDESVNWISLVKALSGFCWLAWIVSIGCHAKQKLFAQGIELRVLRNYVLRFFIVAVIYLLIKWVTEEVKTSYGSIIIRYDSPIILPLLFAITFIITTLIAAKALVSAEHKKEAVFKDYFSTMLWMLVPFIGVWFIQPRVRKL
ncbi:MAG: hypothetical protein IPM34_00975 [Saprospiraceae bacterium]|nr:hypothetical protein [Saprospiraceae bacterium]